MAFDIAGWAALANSPLLNIYAYVSATDTLVTVQAAGYFDPKKRLLRTNDRVHVSASDGVVDLRVTQTTGTDVMTLAAL